MQAKKLGVCAVANEYGNWNWKYWMEPHYKEGTQTMESS